ncbi:MAG: DUF1080 domain-containing protein [Phycisphaerae bacterium]|nr:DUF1080 domain-containing protein [Phycisphaerae bacterium]
MNTNRREFMKAAGVAMVMAGLLTGCANVALSPVEDNLSGWACYLEDPNARRQDTWTMKDGILKCTGNPKGYLYTEKSYKDFVLTLQWRWPDANSAGKGGVLIDTTGPNKIWPKSLEAQINATGAGDFWALNGYELSGAPERTKSFDNKQFGKLTHIAKTEAAEKPAGQWNSYKIIAEGPAVTLIVNDRIVNKATRSATASGKICITSEGTPIYLKNIRITRTD